MAEYLYLYRNSVGGPRPAPAEQQQIMQKWMKWLEELGKKGHLKSAGQPLDVTGKIVRNKGASITDGPFAEAKDVVLGFSIVEAKDIAQAAELSKGCPIFDAGGHVEVRPVLAM